ncbi:hypothetical protein CL622_04900 [archaeon]|nr:hypothetical protein [archaeon]
MEQKLLEKFNQIEKEHWWWAGRRSLVKYLIGDLKPKRILDIGCGTGETLSFLKIIYPSAEIWGLDISPKAVKYALGRGHKNIVLGDAGRLKLNKKYFDLVLFLDVLEHIKDEATALREASKVLQPGGRIIITSPALKFIWSAHDKNQGHHRRYTRREIKTLSKAAKLKIEYMTYFNFFLSLPIIVVRSLSNLKKLSYMSSYDNKINFEIASNKVFNFLLKAIFLSEISLLKFLRYPIGISIVATLVKNEKK